jgi:serine/threonine protein kinase
VATGNPQSGAKEYPLWISDTWYILVDRNGKCKSLCAEGALGFVIQLQSDVNQDHHVALKIPRLMGETSRENAYINELAEKELKAVQEIFHKKGATSGLLRADLGSGSLLRGPISIQRGSEEAQQWNGALVFVSFEKGQNPTFCLMKFDGKKPQHYPPNSNACPEIEAAAFEKIREKAKMWSYTVFINSGEVQEAGNGGETNILSVEDALEKSNSAGRTWYTCLPSVMYNWAPVTLQEAISTNERGGPWNKGKHFALIERVCQGLVTLHSKGMLHADVRPANMVYVGAADDPDKYYLSDYGSFSDPGARASDREATGNTVLGPVVSGERISAFYAPERRHSREREAANMAVIYNPNTVGDLYVILGWGSELIDPETKKPKDDLTKYVGPSSSRKQEQEDQSDLVEGDRIQVREYIFDVEEEWHVGNKQILKCKGRFWKIYHGRIVVESRDRFEEWDSFPIPRTVELRQWSAATDLYSLGAMALYSVFCDSVYKQGDKIVNNSGSKDITQNTISEIHSKLEKDFREMLLYLESPPYFNAIWPELEWMRFQLETRLAKGGLTEENLAKQLFKRYTDERTSQKEEKNLELKEAVVELVGRITQSVPGAREVVRALDYDLGTFIFFIHFVLCCLHRQKDVIVDENWKWMDIKTNGPFAEDRLEKPKSGGAATKALERIKRISKLIDDRLLSGLKVEPPREQSSDPEKDSEELTTKNIPQFDPRPTPAILVELNQTKAKLGETTKKFDKTMDTLGETAEKLDQTEKRLSSFRNSVDEALAILSPWWSFFSIERLKKTLLHAKEADKP